MIFAELAIAIAAFMAFLVVTAWLCELVCKYVGV